MINLILSLEFEKFKNDFTNEIIKILFVNEDGKYIFKMTTENGKKIDMNDCVPTLIVIS
jgi:hypothetical protein